MNNKPIRVLQVFGIMNRGGAENMIMNLYRSIDRNRVQFDFVVHSEEKGAFDDEIKSLGGVIYHCPHYSLNTIFLYKKWWNDFFTNHQEYSIIHSHVRSTASIYLKIAKKNNLATIIHSHSTSNGRGIKSLVKKYLQGKIIKYSDYYFACSLESGVWLFGENAVNSDKFFILNNAIRLDDYAFNSSIRKQYRKELKLPDDYIVFIHVGRFHESKNHSFLLNVFSGLHEKNNKTKLLLVGDGPNFDRVKEMADRLHISDSVLFLGVRDDVKNLLMCADCFLFPSKWEGLPVTLIEAQASGITCFVSSNITKDIKVSDSIVFLPIDKGIEIWVNAIISSSIYRRDNKQMLVDAGYDVLTTAFWLSDFYEGLLNEKNNN